jgi:putative nucleotidyltransferase with HDIG domain
MIEIATNELQIGMYVAHLDRPWLETTFLFQGFRIENHNQIEQLQKTCKTVKIDTELSLPTLRAELAKRKPCPATLASHAEPAHKAQTAKARFYEDMKQAKAVYEGVSVSVNKVLNNFRLNNYIAIPEVKSCVQSVIKTMAHNPNAMVLLTNLREKQQDTATHCLNICVYSALFGHYLSFDQQQIESLSMAALLHDVGKLKLPQTVLAKPYDSLSPEEHEQLQKHAEYGAELLRKFTEVPDEIAEVAHSHHEKMDGTGFPRGLKGPEIGTMSKIIGIINEYETLTNNPNLKLQLSCSDALKSIYALRDTHFDGHFTEQFIKCLGIYPVGSIIKLSNGATGIVIGMKQDNHLLPTVMIVRDKSGEIRHPPQVVNLDKFRDHDGKPLLLISRVVDLGDVDMDLFGYILHELGVGANTPKFHK